MPYLLLIFLLFTFSCHGEESNTQSPAKKKYKEKCNEVFNQSIKCYEDIALNLSDEEFINKLKTCKSDHKKRKQTIKPLLREVKKVHKLNIDKIESEILQHSIKLSFCSLSEIDNNKKIKECFISAMKELEGITCDL